MALAGAGAAAAGAAKASHRVLADEVVSHLMVTDGAVDVDCTESDLTSDCKAAGVAVDEVVMEEEDVEVVELETAVVVGATVGDGNGCSSRRCCSSCSRSAANESA